MNTNDNKTLRDEFAMAVLLEVLRTSVIHGPRVVALTAYGIADAMMTARKK